MVAVNQETEARLDFRSASASRSTTLSFKGTEYEKQMKRVAASGILSSLSKL
jgi:hypothetical protein